LYSAVVSVEDKLTGYSQGRPVSPLVETIARSKEFPLKEEGIKNKGRKGGTVVVGLSRGDTEGS
jgi:hypothetical protein